MKMDDAMLRVADVEIKSYQKIYTEAKKVSVYDSNDVLVGYRLVENGAIVAESYWDAQCRFINRD